MDISNIVKGQVFKNYKELCLAIEEPILQGNSKKRQIDEIKRLLKLSKKGHSFKVIDIYNKPIQSLENSSSGYSKNIQLLILDMLSQRENNGVINLSKNQLLRRLSMVNSNYGKGKRNILGLAELLEVDKHIVQDVYTFTDKKLKSILENALNSLVKQYLIYYSTRKMVCEEVSTLVYDSQTSQVVTVVNEVHRKATDEETKEIIKIERKVMEDLGCLDTQELILKKKMNSFRKKVNIELINNYRFLYSYDTYEIISDREFISKRLNKSQCLFIRDEINKKVLNSSYRSVNKKHSNALSSDNDSVDIDIRKSELYVKNSSKVVSNIIDSKTKPNTT